MKSFLLAASAVALSAGLAAAADLAAKPYVKAPIAPAVYDWSGFYVGVNGGGGWSRFGWGSSTDTSTYRVTGSGGTAGGQFGWRTQTGWLVWGFDIQGNWADFGGSFQLRAGDETFTYTSKVTSYETFAATAGYAVNNVLLYAKGGAAAVQSTFGVTGGTPTFSATDSRWGGLLGAGLEYGLTPNWTIGVDYNHIFGGGVNVIFNPSGNSGISENLDIVTARINYKFGGPVIARY